MNITRKDATITNTDDAFPGEFSVILSAPTEDRDGETLLPGEWKTPLPDRITFDADHGMSVASTVGSGVPSLNDAGELVVSGTYSSLARAQEVRTLVNEGHINTTSVAFMTKKSTAKGGKPVITRELLNGAFVAVPSNREALVLASKGAKAGARNSASDMKHMQAAHDSIVAAGADCAGVKSVSTISTKDVCESCGAACCGDCGACCAPCKACGAPCGPCATCGACCATCGAVCAASKAARGLSKKSVDGSLEATQDRARDALSDAYPGVYTYLRATVPNGSGGGTLVFGVEDKDTYDSESFKQDYTDDGSVITLVGERSAVDLVEVIKPDPDEEAAPSGADSAPDAGAQAPAPGAKSAPVAAGDSAEMQARAARLRFLGTVTN